MNALKHFEAVLMLGFGVLCAAFALAPASAPRTTQAASGGAAVASSSGASTAAEAGTSSTTPMLSVSDLPGFGAAHIPVITIIGHRLSPGGDTSGGDMQPN